MKFLFVHQNFPGQYRYVAPALAQRGHEVAGLGEELNVRRQRSLTRDVRLYGYRMPKPPARPDRLLGQLPWCVVRAHAVARAAAQLRARGFVPDVMAAHIGWGEALFLKDVFPDAKLGLFCEYFYQPEGGDYGFDPEFRPSPEGRMRLRLMNAHLLMAMAVCDYGVTATRWQQGRFPDDFQRRVSVL